LNINCAQAQHKDELDYRAGFCWVTTFGTYTGGSLYFSELNIEFNIQPGDLIAFKSYLLRHGVQPYNGQRHSLVLFGHHEVFLPPNPNKKRKRVAR